MTKMTRNFVAKMRMGCLFGTAEYVAVDYSVLSSRKCNHVPAAYMKKLDPPNCLGTFLVSILMDPDRFQNNLEGFKNVHFCSFRSNLVNGGGSSKQVLVQYKYEIL